MGDSGYGQRTAVSFGRRRVVPRVCVVDVKLHIRMFLADTLEELGFIPRQCSRISDVAAALTEFEPDLIVLGSLTPESEITKTLHLLMSAHYTGRVMLFGGRAASSLLALHEFGEQAGLAMLPPLGTPFRDSDLHDNLSPFLPIPDSPAVNIDVEEALQNDRLELWYQPKIDLRQMSLCGAEALIRMRHPAWGIAPPASFIPNDGDPNLQKLSEFVMQRAMADWTFFSEGRTPIDMTIHMPASLLADSGFVDRICLAVPDQAARARLFVEISSSDIRRDHAPVRAAAKQFADCNIGISIDDIMSEASWVDVADFPIAELQVERSFINGCADDRAKRKACEMALDIAEKLGAQTVAKGLERPQDCHTVSKLGFDVGQGFLFAKPMEAHRFARTMLRRRAAKPR